MVQKFVSPESYYLFRKSTAGTPKQLTRIGSPELQSTINQYSILDECKTERSSGGQTKAKAPPRRGRKLVLRRQLQKSATISVNATAEATPMKRPGEAEWRRATIGGCVTGGAARKQVSRASFVQLCELLRPIDPEKVSNMTATVSRRARRSLVRPETAAGFGGTRRTMSGKKLDATPQRTRCRRALFSRMSAV